MIKLMLLLQLTGTQPKLVEQLLPQRRVQIRDTSRNYIIIHNDGGSGGYNSARATLIKRRLSYHYYVKRDGTIMKLLDPKYVASHVGYSVWKGLFRINKYSIGICLENGITKPYTQLQYQSTAWLIKQLRTRYKDTTTYTVVGHSDVALPLGRKDDPGRNFDWKELSILLNSQEM